MTSKTCPHDGAKCFMSSCNKTVEGIENVKKLMKSNPENSRFRAKWTCPRKKETKTNED